MANLKETAVNFKSGKDITDLEKIPTDIEVKTGEFEKNGQKMTYTYFELDGWKYTIKSKVMESIKQMLGVRPQTKFIKVNKTPAGEYFVIPLD